MLQVAVPLESSAPPRISRTVRSALPNLGLSLAAGNSETATVLRSASVPEPPLSASPGFWVQTQLRTPLGGSRARGSRLQPTWPAVALPGPSALRPRAAAVARHMPPPGSSRGTCPGDCTGARLVRLRVLRAPAHPTDLALIFFLSSCSLTSHSFSLPLFLYFLFFSPKAGRRSSKWEESCPSP